MKAIHARAVELAERGGALLDRIRAVAQRMGRDDERSWAALRDLEAQIDAADGEIRARTAVLSWAAEDVAARWRDVVRRLGELEQALAQERSARAQLERAARARDDFLSVLSHDLRAPIQSVLGWSQLLRHGNVPEEARERALTAIERSSRAQLRLVEELLDIARIASDKMRLDLADVDLAALVERCVEGLRGVAGNRELTFRHASARDVLVVGDRRRLEQVTNNLLSNALKFTGDGGRIDVEIREVEGAAELAVLDDGRGISPEALPTIFERFRQELGAGDPAGGIGLGLYIVRNVVELHGGTVEARSDGVGRGAAFVVRVPLTTAAVAEASSSSRVLAPVGRALEGRRILVVDDERDVAELVSAVLRSSGATVYVAPDVAGAVDAYQGCAPHLLVSDIALGGEDGCDLLRRLRLLDSELPAIALSGLAGADDATRACSAGFDVHLAKPIDASTLIATVVDVLGDA